MKLYWMLQPKEMHYCLPPEKRQAVRAHTNGEFAAVMQIMAQDMPDDFLARIGAE